jgi:hypothetical protein
VLAWLSVQSGSFGRFQACRPPRPDGLAIALGALLVAHTVLAGTTPLVASRMAGRGPRPGRAGRLRGVRAFEASRLVPLDAFLDRRVVASVWTRYRQEYSFGCRCPPDASLPELAAPGAERPDGALFERLEAILPTLDEGELRLIRQLFWDGRSEDELAREMGVTRQAVNKRKQN